MVLFFSLVSAIGVYAATENSDTVKSTEPLELVSPAAVLANTTSKATVNPSPSSSATQLSSNNTSSAGIESKHTDKSATYQSTPLGSGISTAPPVTKQSIYPSKILNLTNWKLTLPIDTAHAGSPDEIKQPELNAFSSVPYFTSSPAADAVIFQANAGGATTSNSGYPRSELREMVNNGKDKASWSNTVGSHSMTIRQAITHLPVVKPEVVAGQIHDATDDVIMIRLEGKHLFVEGSGKNLGDLDTNYNLGTVFTVRMVAESNRISVYYNDVLKVDYAKSGAGYYFKAGVYTQSNTSRGDAPDAYGEVKIYSLSVSHL